MATREIVCVRGTPAAAGALRTPRGESLRVRFIVRDALGVPVSLAGSNVVLYWADRGAAPEAAVRLPLAGDATGIATFDFTAEQTANLSSNWYQFEAWIETGSVRESLLAAAVVVQVTATIALPGPPDPPVVPLIQTHEFAGAIDTAAGGAVPSVPYVRMTQSGACIFTLTVAALQGVGADPLAVGFLAFGRVDASGARTNFATRPALEQTAPGVFRASIPVLLRIAIGDGACNFDATITSGGQSWIAALGSVSFIATSTPANNPPTVTLAALADNVAPGALAISGTYADTDGTITADRFSVTVNGAARSATFTASGGAWSSSVTASALGEMIVVITLTDEGGAVATASDTTNVLPPAVAITSPAAGAVVDVQTVAVSVSCTPAAADGTAVAVFAGATSLGSGVFASGTATITTTELAEGAHVLTARVTTAAGPVDSPTVAISAVDALPVIASTVPVNGAVLASGPVATQATITHTYGRAMLTRARVDGGAWYNLTRVGTTNVYTGTSPAVIAEGAHTLTIQATDASAWGVTAATTEAARAFSISFDVPWNGAHAFAEPFARTEAVALDGVVLLSLSAAGATDGAVFLLDLPADVQSFGVSLPAGYTLVPDVSIVWVDGLPLDGWDPWVPGIRSAHMYRLNADDMTIGVTCRRYLEEAIPAEAYLYPLAVSGAVRATAYSAARVAQAAQAATNENFAAAADPSLTARRSSFGTVLQATGTSRFSMPVAGSTTAGSFICWHRTPAGTGALATFGGAPCATNLATTNPAQARLGTLSIVPDADTYRMWLLPGMNVGEVNFARNDPAADFADLAGQWLHFSFVASGGVMTIKVNGATVLHENMVLSRSWAAGIVDGAGYQLGNGGVQWDSGSVFDSQAMVGAFASEEAATAHFIATSPVPMTGAHVVSIGSSLQAAADGGDNLCEASRVAAGVAATEWHRYCVSGALVYTYNPGVQSRIQQGNRASVDWQSRGMIAILDWGNVGNEGPTAQARMLADTRVLLSRGWRLIMLDHAGIFGGAAEDGAGIRAAQEAYYNELGGAILRVPVRDIMLDWTNRNGGDYTDAIHFSNRTILAIAAYLAPIITELRAETAPISRPAFVTY